MSSISKGSHRIVLVDPLGDVLFSGESMVARGSDTPAERLPDTLPAPAEVPEPAYSAEERTERCPETMRSAGSGVYRSVDRTQVSTVPVIEDVGAQIRAEASRRRLRRVG